MSRVKLVLSFQVKGEAKQEINSLVVGAESLDEWTHVVANFDTGAAITAIPSR